MAASSSDLILESLIGSLLVRASAYSLWSEGRAGRLTPRYVLFPDIFSLDSQTHTFEGGVRRFGDTKARVVRRTVRQRIRSFSLISQKTLSEPTCTHLMDLSDLVPPCAREEARHHTRTLPWVPSYPSSCTSGRSQPFRQVPPSHRRPDSIQRCSPSRRCQ
jgi:hypothetical protein